MLQQFIFDKIISSSKQNNFKYKLLLAARKYLLKCGESTINYRYKEFDLTLPFSHDFPINFKAIPSYSQNLGVLAKVVSQKYSNLKIIDVGANVGDSVAIIQHRVKTPILCIEGNPKFIPLLEKNVAQFSDIEIEKCFLGEGSEKVSPVNNLGTAYLQKSDDGIEVKTLSEVLEKHRDFKNAKLLKIDTDGFDNKIIRGATSFLDESKALVFFEYDPFYLAKQNENGLAIFELFETLGYTKLLLYDNLGLYITTLSTSDKGQLKNFHNYYNQGGSKYLDICALHQSDEDLQELIVKTC